MIGSLAVGNREPIGVLEGVGERSDMGALVARKLADVPVDTLKHAVAELWFRQHNEKAPRDQREEFIGLVQRATDELLGFRRFLDEPEADTDG